MLASRNLNLRDTEVPHTAVIHISACELGAPKTSTQGCSAEGLISTKLSPQRMSTMFALLVACLLSASLVAQNARAQSGQTDQIQSGVKASIGLGLIGAELGLLAPAMAGAEGTWPYIAFPLVGAAGGAAAGYFLLDQPNTSPTLSVALLAVGIGLIIPAVVGTLSLTAYDPEGDFSQPQDQRMTQAGRVRQDRLAMSKAQRAMKSRVAASRALGSLVSFSDQGSALGVPLPSLGVPQRAKNPYEMQLGALEVQLPLVSAAF